MSSKTGEDGLELIVQIYEIQNPYEAGGCIECGVDHIGSVVLDREHWKAPVLKEVVDLCTGADVKNSIIPLFNERETIYRCLDYYRPDFIHLCDSLVDNEGEMLALESFKEMQGRIRRDYPDIGIIRSIPLQMEGLSLDLPSSEIARFFEPVSDYFLADTWLGKCPVEGFIGITGKTSARKPARDLVAQSRIPVILAGGLSPENVFSALIEVAPSGADSCTHTNAVDSKGRPVRFQKDLSRVEKFVKEVKRAERHLLL